MLDTPERTTQHALNSGIARARGRIIMRMDAHAAYPPNYIADLVDCMERTGADSVGALWRTQPGGTTIMAGPTPAALAHPFGIGNAPSPPRPHPRRPRPPPPCARPLPPLL